MKVEHTPDTLIAFEADVARCFKERMIRAPVHLDGGNEAQLIQTFRDYVEPNDWVCCTWRSHYKALLKGVPQDQVKQAILDGRSISLCFPEHRVISSAIVGGILPIACGLAMGIKLKRETRKVVCFVGDMTAETGAFHEAAKYSLNHWLPVTFIIEDNNKSVCTDTARAWNRSDRPRIDPPNVVRFHYEPTWPHVGVGERVQF